MKFLILEEVASILHLSPGTARNRISNKAPMPPYLKKGNRLLFPEDEFEKWVKGNLITEQINVDKPNLKKQRNNREK